MKDDIIKTLEIYENVMDVTNAMLNDERISIDIRKIYSNEIDTIIEPLKKINTGKTTLQGTVIECEKQLPKGLGAILKNEKYYVAINVHEEIKEYSSKYMYLKCKGKKKVILEYTQEESSLKYPEVYEDNE